MDGTGTESETTFVNGITAENENNADAMFEVIAGEDVLKVATESNNNNNNNDDDNNNSGDAALVPDSEVPVNTDTDAPPAAEPVASNDVVAPAATEPANANAAVKAPAGPSRPGKVIMDYSTDFPKLPDAPPPVANGGSQAATAGVWGRRPVIKSTEVTDAFKLSPAERASRGHGKFGNTLEEQQKCNIISAATGTKIELCEAKDQSLTILITGKRANVDEARNRLVRELQTQCCVEVSIPKEYHGHIIGTKGQKLRQLETEFLCNIFIPGRDDASNVIRVCGAAEYIEGAARRIREIGEQLARQGTETLSIPRDFYPWIRGAFDETIDRIAAGAPGAKINIPPPASKNETIIITGERVDVEKAAAELRAIYEEKKAVVTTLTCKVPKGQHRFVIGVKRSGIDEILKETDVVVEVPPEDDESDLITLRGPAARLGDALALVYSKASSVISQELRYPEWMRRFLIGPKGATIKQLAPNQKKLKVDFEDGGVIYLEGAPDLVKSAYAALNAEVQRLNKDMASEVVKAPPSLHRHIIGRNGASVNKLKEDYNVQIIIPSEGMKSDEIRVEGNKEGVKNAVAALKEIVTRLENEKPRETREAAEPTKAQTTGKGGDSAQKASSRPAPVEETVELTVNVDPQFHRHFITRGAEVLKEIQSLNGNCQISFPRQETNDSKVTIKGPKSCAESAKARIQEIVDDLSNDDFREFACQFESKLDVDMNPNPELLYYAKTAQVTITFEIPEVHHRSLIPHLNELRAQYNVRIKVPDRRQKNENGELPESTSADDTIQITGRDTKCEAAKKALLDLVPSSKSVRVPLEYHRTFIGRGGEAVRALMNAHSVRIKVPSSDEKNEEITISGSEENVDACIAEVQNRIVKWDKEAEDRKLRSFKVSFDVPAKYHQRLIGPRGTFVQELMKRHNGVQVSIPRTEAESETITITGYEASCNSCREEIEKLISDLESMVTQTVDLDVRFHSRLIGQRGRNLKKVEDEYGVKIRMPGRNDPDSQTVTVMGKDEQVLEECIDYLRRSEEDFISEMIERGIFDVKRTEPAAETRSEENTNQIEITGAPWQLDSMEQFPAMGSAPAPAVPTAGGVWGQRRW